MAESWMDVPGFAWMRDDGVDKGQKFLTGFAVGARLAQEKREYELRVRKFAADEEIAQREHELRKAAIDLRTRTLDLNNEVKLKRGVGMAELTGVLSKWSALDQLDNPQAEAEFWDTARKYPFAQESQNFDNLANIFQRARDYKQRRDLLSQNIEGRKELETVKQEGRLALQEDRLKRLATMKADSEDFQFELAAFKHELGVQNPKGSARFNLKDSDRVAYVDELKSLHDAFTMGMLRSPDGKQRATYDQYRKMAEEVISKYEGRTHDTGANAPSKILKFNPVTGKVE